MKIVILLLVLEIISQVSTLNFQDPNQDGVEYDDTKSPAEVTVDENNNSDKITILHLVEVQNEPKVSSVSLRAPLLEAEIQQEDGEYVLKVKQLDYESLVNDSIDPSFSLMISDSKSMKRLNVNIKNIDDESPTLKALGTECHMEEETIIDANDSTCIFEVSDPDGWLSSVNFKVTEFEESVSDLFELKYKTTPGDTLQKTNVYLVLKTNKTLDYETREAYDLVMDAEDAAGHSIGQKFRYFLRVTDKPPVWTVLPSVKHINEETETSFQIVAIDPDQNFPNEVIYRLTSYSTFGAYVNLDKNNGNVSVSKINRELGIANISVTVLVQYRDSYSSASTEGTILLVIDDIDDNAPIIYKIQDSLNIPLPKNSSKVFLINIQIQDDDVDEENAAYDLDFKINDDIRSAVDVSPKRGYFKTIVEVTIDTAELNRNLPNLNSFEMELWARGVKTPENEDTWPIVVNLEQGGSSGEKVGISWMIATILICVIMTM